MNVEQIGIHAESIPGSRSLVAIPSQNPSVGPTLEVTGYAEQGYMLVLTDPAGALVWRVMLNAEGAVGGADFGSNDWFEPNGEDADGD